MTSNSSLRRKLLLISSCCDGTDVGEAWTSFQWARHLARRHDVTLLTYRKRDKPAAGPQLPNVRVIEWLDLPLVGKWERFNSMVMPGYVSFYFRVRSWIKDHLRAGETFEIVHQISPLALRYPSPAAGLGIPLVIGPLGGSLDTPRAFLRELGSVPWYTRLRNIDRWRLRHDPLLRRSYAAADLLIGVAPYVRDLLDGLTLHQFAIMSETGLIELPKPRSRSQPDERAPLRLLFVGRIVRSKGLRDAIRAVAKVGDVGPLKFDVVGWGDDLPACRREAQELGITDKVVFHGRLPRGQVERFYADADVFVFPSFREPSANVVIEAMGHGLPSVVADRGGPGFVVDDQCGFRIPVSNPDEFASEIAVAIRKFASSPELVATMGAASREKIRRHFLWDEKANRMAQFYDAVLDRRTQEPAVQRTGMDLAVQGSTFSTAARDEFGP